MEEIKNATISINLTEGNIVISGSEEFVEKNMETVFSFVERTSKSEYIPNKLMQQKEDRGGETPIPEKNVITEGTTPIAMDKYIKAGIYHIDSEGSISILKKIPGTSNSEKMKNIALIVLYIRKEKIMGKEIIPICEKHSCFDSANFASIFKKERTNIIKKGNGQSWTIELTQPGEEAALALLEEMANDKK